MDKNLSEDASGAFPLGAFFGAKENHQIMPPTQCGAEAQSDFYQLKTLLVPLVAFCQRHGISFERFPQRIVFTFGPFLDYTTAHVS